MQTIRIMPKRLMCIQDIAVTSIDNGLTGYIHILYKLEKKQQLCTSVNQNSLVSAFQLIEIC